MAWKNVFYTLFVIGCLFFAVPVKIGNPPKLEERFQSFVEIYNKSYLNNETEYLLRFKYFQNSLKIIDELNANRTAGSAIYGITKFCDLSQKEFERKHLRRIRRDRKKHVHHRRKRAPMLGLPEKFDWRQKGVITAVRNQKMCGACWAFSTVETIESMNAINNRPLQDLSVQQIIDCAGNGNNGCNGGDSRLLLEWLLENKIGIEPEKAYPYVQRTDSCQYKQMNGSVRISSFSCKNMIGGEDSILESLSSHGPVAVAVNAANWQFYLGGIIKYHCAGDAMYLNHAVQLVGYVNSGVDPYYIARNSWGTSFGDKGYIYLKIGGNICGLANEVCRVDVL